MTRPSFDAGVRTNNSSRSMTPKSEVNTEGDEANVEAEENAAVRASAARRDKCANKSAHSVGYLCGESQSAEAYVRT
jgi:hypothetical protein